MNTVADRRSGEPDPRLATELDQCRALCAEGKWKRAAEKLNGAISQACLGAGDSETLGVIATEAEEIVRRGRGGGQRLAAWVEQEANRFAREIETGTATNAESLDAPSAQPAGITSKKLFGITHRTWVLDVLVFVWAGFVFVIGVLLTILATHPILGAPASLGVVVLFWLALGAVWLVGAVVIVLCAALWGIARRRATAAWSNGSTAES
jgi:hypothetical protein